LLLSIVENKKVQDLGAFQWNNIHATFHRNLSLVSEIEREYREKTCLSHMSAVFRNQGK
jgi:hypothetical protein